MTHRTLSAASGLALLWVSAGPAAAIEFRHREPAFVPVHHCTCRFEGKDVELGERRCIATPQGAHAAVCVMEQNVTSWRPSREGCPEASLPAPRG